MTIARQITMLSRQAETLRREQIAIVRRECQKRRLSTRKAGRLIGQAEVRGLFSDEWDPPQTTLDDLEHALFGDLGAQREPLMAVTVKNESVIRDRSPRFGAALDIWREAGGVWTNDVKSRLATAGVLDQSTIIRDTPDGLFVDERSDLFGYWNDARKATGVPLFARPDPEFNDFVFRRAMVPMATGEPQHDRCVGWCGLIGANLRYFAGLYAFSDAPHRAPGVLLSVVTPDPEMTPPPAGV